MSRRRGMPRLRAWVAGALLALALASAPARADLTDDVWKRGNDAYLRGDYAAAVAAYEQLDRQLVSAELAFNLGNAYYRQGQLGRAIWCWERALALDPEHEDARYNLTQARKVEETRVHDKIEGAEREPTWVRAVGQLGAATEAWLFVGLYVAFFVALGLRVRARRQAGHEEAEAGHGSGWTALAAILGVAAALAGLLLMGRVAMDRMSSGVVLADQADVKEGADPNYKTSFQVHAGLRVRLLDRDQDWVRIRLANGLEGWVRDRDIGRL